MGSRCHCSRDMYSGDKQRISSFSALLVVRNDEKEREKNHVCSSKRGYNSNRDCENSVQVQNKEVFTIERCISSKNRSVRPESVQNKEVFTRERCSLTEVLLYN